MRLNALTFAALLSLSVVIVAPFTVHAAGLTITPQQGLVGSEVTIVNLTGYGSGEFQILWGEDRQVIKQGTTSGQGNLVFTIPESARGKHKVTLKVDDDIFDAEYMVLPSIDLSDDKGFVGSSLTVSGHGFNQNENGIQLFYGGSIAERDIVADKKGNWKSTIKVPPSASGNVNIDAEGTTPATDVEDRLFSILPKMEINPTAGGVGTMVAAQGTGYGSSETGIVISFDGIQVKTGIAADSRGSWQSSFFVPTSPKGRHRVNSFGEITGEDAVTVIDFSVSPVLKLELTSGLLGDAILVGDEFWVSGIGFEENEGSIQVTFDGVMVASGIVADAKGSWAVQVSVPTATRGKHVIDASGNTTRSDDVTNGTLVVSPYIEINPTTGGIGTDVSVKGAGFSGNQAITISYDGVQVLTGQTTDGKGSFTTSFKVPVSKPGDHTVTVNDATASVASARFSTETTPPPVPKLVSPEAGTRLGFIGDTVVTFNWTIVEDPSGVSYALEVSHNSNFSGAVLRKDNLSVSAYTLTKEEALPSGDYYWRVKAIDGAGNEGEWTNGQLFRIASDFWIFPVALAVIVVIALIVWRVVTLTRRGWK